VRAGRSSYSNFKQPLLLVLIGQANGFGDRLRFSWGLGPDGADSPIKGTDFAVVEDGRIRSITGFLDQVPAGA
jgi:hypothetical protein